MERGLLGIIDVLIFKVSVETFFNAKRFSHWFIALVVEELHLVILGVNKTYAECFEVLVVVMLGAVVVKRNSFFFFASVKFSHFTREGRFLVYIVNFVHQFLLFAFAKFYRGLSSIGENLLRKLLTPFDQKQIIHLNGLQNIPFSEFLDKLLRFFIRHSSESCEIKAEQIGKTITRKHLRVV